MSLTDQEFEEALESGCHQYSKLVAARGNFDRVHSAARGLAIETERHTIGVCYFFPDASHIVLDVIERRIVQIS